MTNYTVDEACKVMADASRRIREQEQTIEFLTTALLFIRAHAEVPGRYQSIVWGAANGALAKVGL